MKPSWSGVSDDVLENARERGIEVDAQFCEWLNGKLHAIPPNTREDSRDLLLGLMSWWNAKGFEKHGPVAAQVLLADDEIAGTADIVGDGVADLKTVSNLEPTYRLQVGGYCHLFEAERKKLPDWCGIIHVNKRFREPKWVSWEPAVVVSEFRTALQMWRMVNRLSRKTA